MRHALCVMRGERRTETGCGVGAGRGANLDLVPVDGPAPVFDIRAAEPDGWVFETEAGPPTGTATTLAPRPAPTSWARSVAATRYPSPITHHPSPITAL